MSDRLGDWLIVIVRVRRKYYEGHSRYPRLLWPKTFTEKIQWRKLFDLNPMYAIFCDKIAVRDFIKARVGPNVLIPILWVGEDPDRIPFDELRPPYIIKSTHASGDYIRVADDAALDRADVRVTCRTWLTQPYGYDLGGEPGYDFVPRRIVIERMLLTAAGFPPNELRAFVFDGRVQVVQTVLTENGHSASAAFHDRDWQRLRWRLTSPLRPENFPRPARLDRLIELAERIASGFDHLRVDFYDFDDDFRVGEITLYSWSGFLPFNPEEADSIMGSHWRIRSPMWRALKAICVQRREIRPPTSRQ